MFRVQGRSICSGWSIRCQSPAGSSHITLQSGDAGKKLNLWVLIERNAPRVSRTIMQKTQPATAGRGHAIREMAVAVIVALLCTPGGIGGYVQTVQYTDSRPPAYRKAIRWLES